MLDPVIRRHGIRMRFLYLLNPIDYLNDCGVIAWGHRQSPFGPIRLLNAVCRISPYP